MTAISLLASAWLLLTSTAAGGGDQPWVDKPWDANHRLALPGIDGSVELPCSEEELSVSSTESMQEYVCHVTYDVRQFYFVRRSPANLTGDMLPLNPAPGRDANFASIRNSMQDFPWMRTFEEMTISGHEAFKTHGVDRLKRPYAVGVVDLGSEEILTVRIVLHDADETPARFNLILSEVMRSLEFSEK